MYASKNSAWGKDHSRSINIAVDNALPSSPQIKGTKVGPGYVWEDGMMVENTFTVTTNLPVIDVYVIFNGEHYGFSSFSATGGSLVWTIDNVPLYWSGQQEDYYDGRVQAIVHAKTGDGQVSSATVWVEVR